MLSLNFNVEETNIIAIYKAETWDKTVENIVAALPYMDEYIRTIAERAFSKLTELSEEEFTELSFSIADDTEGAGEYE